MSDKLEAPCRITWGRRGNLLIQTNLPTQREQRVKTQSQEKGVSENQVLWRKGKISGRVRLCCCSVFSATSAAPQPPLGFWLPLSARHRHSCGSQVLNSLPCCIQMFPLSLNLFFQDCCLLPEAFCRGHLRALTPGAGRQPKGQDATRAQSWWRSQGWL